MSNPDENETLELRVRLVGPIIEKFRKVKSEKGLVADSEVVRQLIVEESRRLEVPA